MPEWIIHFYTSESFCNIPRSVYEEVTKFINSTHKPEYHDANRVIIEGHWIPEALLHLALVTYERWGYIGLKTMLHHHLLDYTDTLVTSGPYGFLVRKYGPNYGLIGVIKFVHKVLDHIESDFTTLLRLLKEGRDANSIIQEVEKTWIGGIKYRESLLSTIKEKRKDLERCIEDLLRATREIRECIDVSVVEVSYLSWREESGHKDVCPVCKSLVSSLELSIMTPREYIQKDLAYKVHEKCLEYLKSVIEKSSKQGLSGIEVFKKLIVEHALPPSVAFETLKEQDLIKPGEVPRIFKSGSPQIYDRGLEEEWSRLVEDAVAQVERMLEQTSPADDIISKKKSPIVIDPESRVSSFYRVLYGVLGLSKHELMPLLKEGKRDVVLNKLKEQASKMFKNVWIVSFPPEAIDGVDRVYLTPTALAGLVKICEIANVKIEFKLGWSKAELIDLLTSIYEKVSYHEREWIDILKRQIEL
jgi:hypothetical protein